MKNLLITILLLSLFVTGSAQLKKISFKESTEDIRNPERGFYIPIETKASHFIPLSLERLVKYRTEEQKMQRATYSIAPSLIYKAYELDTFTHKALSPDFLKALQNDFDIVRKAGMKIILRFAYINKSHGGDCKDDGGICPPYGDAPYDIVMLHIQQLKPVLHKNADIIAVLQQGFVGIWGENYYTDYFGSGSSEGNGTISDSSWRMRNSFLKALLQAIPTNRMVQVRTPQIKQRYVYGVHAPVTAAAMGANKAFSKTDIARIGFHNDCFLASNDDYGTFYDYGNSISKRDTANSNLRNYVMAESKFLPVGGETCDDAFSPQNDCEPLGHAETEMAAMHYSYLNASYNNTVNNDWDSLGCMKSIKNRLGYRFVLQEAVLPQSLKSDEIFKLQLTLINRGYASPFNPRPVQLVLRNTETKKVFIKELPTSIQKWFSGKIQLSFSFSLPPHIPKGSYEVLLNLPDEYPSIRNNPAYSIRLANEGLWEEATGYNSLHHIVSIK